MAAPPWVPAHVGADLNQVHGRERLDGSEAGRFVGEVELLRHLAEVGSQKKKWLADLFLSQGLRVFTRWVFLAAAGDLDLLASCGGDRHKKNLGVPASPRAAT